MKAWEGGGGGGENVRGMGVGGFKFDRGKKSSQKLNGRAGFANTVEEGNIPAQPVKGA